MFLIVSMSSESSEARAARRARRSSCVARVIDGASDEVVATLVSDDDEFFGEDTISESPPGSPPAKRPCVVDDWHEPSEEVVVCAPEPEDVGEASDGEEPPQPARTNQEISA